MRLVSIPLLAAFLLAACHGNGPIFPVQPKLYDWVKTPGAVDQASDNKPVITDPVVTFRLNQGDKVSALRPDGGWRLGQTRLIGFDIRVDPNVLGDQVVDLSRFSRVGNPGAQIVSVQLDARRGITVMGRSCVAPSKLTAWHRVEVRMRLRDDDHGYLEVFCDRNPIWARTNIRTTFPPVCRLRDGCNARVPKPVRYEWQVGLISDNGVSKPISVQMQRLHHRVLIYTPNRVGSL